MLSTSERDEGCRCLKSHEGLFLVSSSVTVLERDDLTGAHSQQYQSKLGVLLLTIPLTVVMCILKAIRM